MTETQTRCMTCGSPIESAHIESMTDAAVNHHLEPMLTMDELSRYTQTSKSTLYSLRSQGRGPKGIRIGRALRFRKSDVDAWLHMLSDESRAA